MKSTRIFILITLLGLNVACDQMPAESSVTSEHTEPQKGEHGGTLLRDSKFALEITIFERGVPPQYRIWPSFNGQTVSPDEVDLTIRLNRLNNVTDVIGFTPEADFLRGDMEIYEPHSFVVNVDAKFRGNNYSWAYDSFEGRTQISDDIINVSGVEVEKVGPATLRESVTAYGNIVADQAGLSHVSARFEGVIQSVNASLGETIKKGRRLATIEANDSLNSYNIVAPISGTIVERHANPGESTSGRTLFTILDTSVVWAELAIFPAVLPRVKIGSPVRIESALGDFGIDATISQFKPTISNDQSITARVRVDNQQGGLIPGSYVTAEIGVAEYEVPLAVKRSALQPFRDFTVVFAQYDDVYEVRMLDLGRQDDTWAEVLSGITPGTSYVTSNSYLIKADVEKSGASHDH